MKFIDKYMVEENSTELLNDILIYFTKLKLIFHYNLKCNKIVQTLPQKHKKLRKIKDKLNKSHINKQYHA